MNDSVRVSDPPAIRPGTAGGEMLRGGGGSVRGGRRPFTQSRNIAGTRDLDSSNGLRGANRVVDVFVGGCDKQCNSNDIESYCKDIDISPRKCESLNSKSIWYNSFKISIDFENLDTILSANFWPKGVFVRRFYNARTRE